MDRTWFSRRSEMRRWISGDGRWPGDIPSIESMTRN
ncbi:unnamed protein product [Arabidopsis halleri]